MASGTANAALDFTHVTMPNYTTAFDFEGEFHYPSAQQWMERNWTTSFYYAGIYMLILYTGKAWMSGRPRFEIRGPLALWNLFLAAFSIMGAYRTVPETLYILNNKNGFHHSVCFPTHHHNSVWAFWACAFVLSKVFELGDTIFIVLRKQPLIFLHYYHHITVLIYSWYSYAQYIAPARWYIVMNFVVHSFMYSYYGLKALKYRVPLWVSGFITGLQILQMIVGVVVNVHALQAKVNGVECDVPEQNINLSLVMYGSYFLLFLRFFYKAYVQGGKKGGRGNGSIQKSKEN